MNAAQRKYRLSVIKWATHPLAGGPAGGVSRGSEMWGERWMSPFPRGAEDWRWVLTPAWVCLLPLFFFSVLWSLICPVRCWVHFSNILAFSWVSLGGVQWYSQHLCRLVSLIRCCEHLWSFFFHINVLVLYKLWRSHKNRNGKDYDNSDGDDW